jgi:hypothetical protein
MNCEYYYYLLKLRKNTTHDGGALDGDLEEAGASTLSPFEVETPAASVFALELKYASQLIKWSN